MGSLWKGGVTAVQSWARSFNDRGGLYGRPVNVIVADDGADPARSKANVKDLVERHGVVALVGDFSAATRAAHSAYIAEKKIPVVGGEGGTDDWVQNPMYFLPMPFGDVQIYGSLVEASLLGKKKLAFLYCAEVDACRAGADWAQDFSRELGLEVVYSGQISVAQPDFTAECLQARNRGADMMFIAADATATARGVTSCFRQNYKPLFVNVNAMQSDLLVENAGLAAGGITLAGDQPVFPWFLKDGSPGITEFVAALQRYAPGNRPDGSTAMGWASAKLLEKALRRSGDPTSAGILRGLWSLKDETLDGLTIPLTFTERQRSSKGRCWFPTQIKDGAWTAPLGAGPRCANRNF